MTILTPDPTLAADEALYDSSARADGSQQPSNPGEIATARGPVCSQPLDIGRGNGRSVVLQRARVIAGASAGVLAANALAPAECSKKPSTMTEH